VDAIITNIEICRFAEICKRTKDRWNLLVLVGAKSNLYGINEILQQDGRDQVFRRGQLFMERYYTY